MAKRAREPHLPPLYWPSELPKARPRQQQAVASDGSVIATRLAKHPDLSRQCIQQLVDENVMLRLPNGRFDQDDCRRWLRDPERRSARTQADADFVKAKTELIALREREKKKELIELEYAQEVMDKAIAAVLTAMSGTAVRCAGRDLPLRRKIDQVIFETRVQLASIFNQLADEAGGAATNIDTTDNAEKDDGAQTGREAASSKGDHCGDK